MELLEKETVIFNNEVVTLCDYIVSTNDSDEKSLVTATPLLADYMTAETACEVIQRYFKLQTVPYTKILALVHPSSDTNYLLKFKDIEKEVIQRYSELQTVHRTRILAFVHFLSDTRYLVKFKDIELTGQIKIDSIVEKITFMGHMNNKGGITKVFINVFCTEIQ